jgi:DNA-binding CsgD family transcriptional regulator
VFGGSAPAPWQRVLGRDRELDKIQGFLRAAIDGRSTGSIRIAGASGFGKSALLKDALSDAARDGWLVFDSRCYAGQRRTPDAALRRLVADRVPTLDESMRRYVSGLELELTSPTTPAPRLELASVRLMEGLVLDHPCVLAFDDAQWLDSQTFAALHGLFETSGARSLVVAFAHQLGYDVPELPAATKLTVSLAPLKREASEEIVARLWPGVARDVATSIAERAGGIAFDVVALALQAKSDGASTPDDVSASAHAVLRESIVSERPDQREFLQLCSLMREPVDLRIVRRVIRDESRLDRFITRSGRYLELDGAVLRFRHALIAEAARSTISSPLSLRRKILAAYLSSKEPRSSDHDAIAALAAEIGDTDTEFRALCALGAAAYADEAYDAAIAAFEKAFSLRRPDDGEFVLVYNQYTIALRILARWQDAHRVLDAVVTEGITRGVPHIGLLASALLYVIRMEADREAARARYRQLRGLITATADRHELLARGASLAAEAADAGDFERIRAEISTLPTAPSRYAAATFHMAEATLMCRLGEFAKAAQALGIARAHVDRQQSVHQFSVDCYGNQMRIRQYGCAGTRIQLGWLQPREDGSLASHAPPQMVMLYALQLAATVDFARGNWDAALATIDSANLSTVAPCPARTQLLGIVAALGALSGQTSELAAVIESDLRHCYERGLFQRSLPLAFWWAAFIQGQRPRDAAALVEPLLHLLDYPTDSTTFTFPLARVLYAKRAKDDSLLRLLLDSRRAEAAPWDEAQELLAAGLAYDALGDRRAKPLLTRARDTFDALDAAFFTAYAAAALGAATSEQRALLQSLEVGEALTVHGAQRRQNSDGGRRLARPTLRERETAALVAAGYSNRQIAERLTLSERTVEVHIARLFDKLNVDSRTQLVRAVIVERLADDDVPPPPASRERATDRRGAIGRARAATTGGGSLS